MKLPMDHTEWDFPLHLIFWSSERSLPWLVPIIVCNHHKRAETMSKLSLVISLTNTNFLLKVFDFYPVLIVSERCVSINPLAYNTTQYDLCPSEFHPTFPSRPLYPTIVKTSINESDGDDSSQIYCRYRSVEQEKGEGKKAHLCLDIKGQQISPDASIIGSVWFLLSLIVR